MLRFLFLTFLSFGLSAILTISTSFSTAWSADLSSKDQVQLVQQIDARFRSSSFNIDADVLLKVAAPKIGQQLLMKLATSSEKDVIGGYRKCPDCNTNAAVVENVLKLQQLAKICHGLCFTEDISAQVSKQYRKLNPDELLKVFTQPNSTNILESDFDYDRYLLVERTKDTPTNNDLYNFKMAAAYYGEGVHKTHQVTFRLFSRGHKNRNFIVAVGQEQVLDILENLKFTDHDIATLKTNPEFKHIPKDFFDQYLRNFKFKGSVRMVPVGTIVFADEPIMEITGDPVEMSIIETIITPWINKMSNFTTRAALHTLNAGERALLEAGTRRGVDGFWSAYAAVLAGFKGTSNVAVAKQTLTRPGGTEAHQWIGFWGDEILAHSIYRKYFPETSLLNDTYNIEDGTKKAAIASGSKFKGVRVDSTIPGLASDETVAESLTSQKVSQILKDLGYDFGTYTLTLSNKLTPNNLADHTAMKSLFNAALVGTDIAAPPDATHLAVVYKNVEVVEIASGAVSHPTKLAEGKVLQPGQTQLYRSMVAGKISKDIVALSSESPSNYPHYQPIIIDAMSAGKKLLKPASVVSIQSAIKTNLATLPERISSLQPLAPELKFKPGYSVEAKKVLEEAKQRAAGGIKKKFGVIVLNDSLPASENNLLTEKLLIERARLALNLDDVITVSREQLNKGIKLASFIPQNIKKDEEVYIVLQSNVLSSLRTWKNVKYLAQKLNWVVALAKGEDFNMDSLDPLLFSDFKKVNSDSLSIGPNGNKVLAFNFNLPATNLNEVHKISHPIESVFHDVDDQLTFWEAMHGEEAGPLAVGGSTQITENVAMLKYLSLKDPRIKATASGDKHLDVELRHSELNLEFHTTEEKTFKFPPHAMAGVAGPVGDARIPEVLIFDKEKILEVEHHEVDGESLKLVPFDLYKNINQVLDPDTEVYIRKNGPDAYNVWQNPYTEQIFKAINPRSIYVFGVATDFCVTAFVKGALTRGYNVLLITDAIAGVFPESTAQELKAMKDLGVKFIKTEEVLNSFGYKVKDVRAKVREDYEKNRHRFLRACRSLFEN